MTVGFVPDWLTASPPKKAATTDRRRPRVRATYDAATDGGANDNHWSWADSLDPNSLNTPDARKKLRDRARYEVRNNSYAKGLVATVAHDLVGTGPRLVLDFGDGGRELARAVEKAWKSWCKAVNLPGKLRLLHQARLVDGEGLALLSTNDRVDHPVKLDVRLFEADRLESPFGQFPEPGLVDGVEVDRAGNPVAYFVANEHPGGMFSAFASAYTRRPAADVLHWFRADRAEQLRGVSELAPSLPLFAQLRRYTLATVTAAEFAANLAGVMKTNLAPPDDGSAVETTAMDELPMVRGMLLTLPHEWDATQFKSEQPTSTYKEFKDQLLNEIGRCLQAPFNVIAGNSSGYNYSSGRLDHQIYHRSLWIEREQIACLVLYKVLSAWWEYYTLVPESEGGAPRGLPPLDEVVYDWHWDGFASIDPLKEATASQTRLALNLTTYAEECAAEGKDWEETFRQRARENELAAELGLVAAAAPAAAAVAPPSANPARPAAEEDTVLEDEGAPANV